MRNMMGMMGTASPCIVCSEKNNNSIDNQLSRLIDRLRREVKNPTRRGNNTYYWDVTTHCRYGMGNCMQKNMGHTNALTEEAGALLDAYLETDCKNYHEILRYLQGYFPRVYNQFERAVLEKKK